VIVSDEATFFDPHVDFGLVAALEPISMLRRMPLGEVMRMSLMGLDERIGAQRAFQIGLASEVGARNRTLGASASDRVRHRGKTVGCNAGHRSCRLGITGCRAIPGARTPACAIPKSATSSGYGRSRTCSRAASASRSPFAEGDMNFLPDEDDRKYRDVMRGLADQYGWPEMQALRAEIDGLE
jgi:enoyl-CoA hydratase/carnithine racemase